MERYIDEYIAHIHKQKKYKPNTAEAYARDLRQFAAFLAQEGIDAAQPARVTKTAVMAYAMHVQREGKSAATVIRMLSAIRTFFGYLIANGHLRSNPAAEVDAPKPMRAVVPNVLTTAQIDALIAQTAGDAPLAVRDCAMLEVLYGSALHVSELVALECTDVDLERRVVRAGARVMPLSKAAVVALQRYLAVRSALAGGEQTTALFLKRNGQMMTRQGCWKMIRARAVKAGIQETVTPRQLRGSLAAHLVANGVDASAVQTMLGMSAAIPGYADVRGIDVLRRAHPRG